MQANFSLSKEIMGKLTKDKKDSGRDKSATVTRALQRYWLADVEVENMTIEEVKITFDEVNDKLAYLRKLEHKLYIRLEEV